MNRFLRRWNPGELGLRGVCKVRLTIKQVHEGVHYYCPVCDVYKDPYTGMWWPRWHHAMPPSDKYCHNMLPDVPPSSILIHHPSKHKSWEKAIYPYLMKKVPGKEQFFPHGPGAIKGRPKKRSPAVQRRIWPGKDALHCRLCRDSTYHTPDHHMGLIAQSKGLIPSNWIYN